MPFYLLYFIVGELVMLSWLYIAALILNNLLLSGEEWFMDWIERLDWERKSQTVCGQTHHRAADSADHIKVRNATFQAGVCVYVGLYICFLLGGQQARRWSYAVVGQRLMAAVWKVGTCTSFHGMEMRWACVFVCVWVDGGKLKKRRERSEALAACCSWFSPRGFRYTLVVISLTNNLPGD